MALILTERSRTYTNVGDRGFREEIGGCRVGDVSDMPHSSTLELESAACESACKSRGRPKLKNTSSTAHSTNDLKNSVHNRVDRPGILFHYTEYVGV